MEICLKILYFFGAILSFADPVTDGLTCWKYFEAGKILWFAMCVVFMVLPSIVYFIFWVFILPTDESTRSGRMASKLRCCLATAFCPFISCCGRIYVAVSTRKHKEHDLYMEVFNCLEVGIQLAPQFILQFFAAMVQEKDVSTIQIISLTVTFLRIGWCYAHISDDCTCRLCWGGLVSVAARVFAFSLFAVALGAWVVLVIVLHMAITCLIQRSHRVRAFGYVALSWLSYTPLGEDKDKETDEQRVKWTSRTFVQPLVQVVEDIFMAIMYYLFVDSSGRTYPHRLEITLGLLGGTLLGYIALRLSKFGKCQGRQLEINEEGCEENLNKQEGVTDIDGNIAGPASASDDTNSNEQNKVGQPRFTKAWVRAKFPKFRNKQTESTTEGQEDGLDREEADIGIETNETGQTSNDQSKVAQPRFTKAWVRVKFPRSRNKQTEGTTEGKEDDLDREEADIGIETNETGQTSNDQNLDDKTTQQSHPPRFGKAWVRSRLARFQGKQRDGNEGGGGDLRREEEVIGTDPGKTEPASPSNDANFENQNRPNTTNRPRFGKAWVASRLKLK